MKTELEIANERILELENQVKKLSLNLPVSGMLPINDVQIRAYGLLQLIAKAEMAEPSPYNPENDIRKRNIANWKQEYYTLIGNLR